MATVEIQLLGRFAVRRDGQPVAPGAFGGRLARRLVRLLATRRGSVVPRSALIEALWPQRRPTDPDANLNVQVNRARQALGSGLIQTATGGYLLTGDDQLCAIDTERLVSETQAARSALPAEPQVAIDRFTTALQQWHGDPLPEDAYEDWALAEADRLREVHQRALEGAAEAALAVGDAPLALDLASRAIDQRPLREPAHLLRIQALAAVGDRAGALESLADLRRRLRDELGVDPSSQAEELQRRILRGDSEAPATTTTKQVRGRETPGMPLRFVGRGEEVQTVVSTVTGPVAGATVVAGRSGAGKSRLLTEASVRCGCPVLQARAFPSEADEPFSVARTVLTEALSLDIEAFDAVPARAAPVMADLLPDLDLSDPDESGDSAEHGVDPEARRSLMLEAAVRLVDAATGDRLLVVVDDLQWADATSLRFLARAVERVDRLGLAVGYRPEELNPGGEVASFLQDLTRAVRVSTVNLDGLTHDAIIELIPDELVARTLSQTTDRTPFAVAEVVGALAGQHLLESDGHGGWRPRRDDIVDEVVAVARDGQRRVTTNRITDRPRRQSDLLVLLALRGRETTADLLATATDRRVEIITRDLDALADAELVRHGESGWAPAHDRIGDTALRDLPRSRGTDLHRRLAAALRAERADPAEVGRHLAAAGDPGAAAACATAAHQRLDAFATVEALDLATAGLAANPDGPVALELLEVRAEAHHRQGNLAEARDDLRSALRTGPTGPGRARLQARLAMLELGAEDLTRAAELIELAIVDAGADVQARAEVLSVAAIVDMNSGNAARSGQRSRQAMELYRSLGDAQGVAGILDGQAMADFLDGEVGGAVEAFDRVAKLFIDSGNPLRAITPRSTAGHARVFADDPTGGLGDTLAALELARELGDREGEAYALWHCSEAMTGAGRLDAARDAARRALEVAVQIGHRGWTATAHRALGVALQAAGDLATAEGAFHRSLDCSEHLSLFGCWANARLGLVLVAQGRLDDAAPFVTTALDEGPPLGRFEARLAHAELCHARGDDHSSDIAAAALVAARRAGHLAGTERLAELARTAT